ncbi:MAG: aconitate hydratase [Lysobacterales bacterium]|jgi:aconitate hydratase
MTQNLARKLLASHLAEGQMTPGEEIRLRVDQTLTQDATGTLVMLELEALRLDRVCTECSVQYVDHNLVQQDHRNADDHRFLFSACQRFGLWYSGPGNGVSHPVHMMHFGRPGAFLLGSDSHTPAAGSLGMLAIGAGGLDVAMAMAGEAYAMPMPEIWGIRLTGRVPDWVSAKDVILEMLRRHGVDGGLGRIVEYHGPGVNGLSAMDRHVIANMGAELGATTSLFPSDNRTREFLVSHGREEDWQPLAADENCSYDHEDEIDLSALQPLIARPSSPGNVVPVADVAGEPIYQSYVGSSANPGYRDFAICAQMVAGRTVHPSVSFDVNPTSRVLLLELSRSGLLAELLASGARLHQAGCNGCIGMGQAPASDQNSLRTTPRNFPGRSGTREDRVWLCSPETAAASALNGVITDPRTLDMDYPLVSEPETFADSFRLLIKPPADGADIELVKGPNISSLPQFGELPDAMTLPVLLKLGDHLSTDEIMPAGTRVLPYRSNIPEISRFCFDMVDDTYAERARDTGDHAVVAGRDYGQGSSREHAALAPRYLGLRVVIAKSLARIHERNLALYGVLPLRFDCDDDYQRLEQDSVLEFRDLRASLEHGDTTVRASIDGDEIRFRHGLSAQQRRMVLAGGRIPLWKKEAREAD